MLLVVGATGLLGTEICHQALLRQQPVRALVRATSNPEKVHRLKSAGATIAVGDLKRPEEIQQACKGVSQIITTASCTFSRHEGDSIETVDRVGQLHLIDCAKREGVEHFVYVSIPPGLPHDCPLFRAKREVECGLARCGMEYTILLSNYFMEVWLGPALGLDYANHRATVYGTGESPISWVSFKDVAAISVDSLWADAARNRQLLVGGPDSVTPNEVIRVFENATGRRFTVDHVPRETLEKQYAEAADPLTQSFAALMLAYDAGCAMDMRETLSVLPRRLKTISEYAGQVGGSNGDRN